ncbi:MAG: hypothetical protein RLZZ517_194 [Candidatus Parcubacteria bacterium]|jgi:predicted membrane channel-forming protein YqfA (hemolysin III family)
MESNKRSSVFGVMSFIFGVFSIYLPAAVICLMASILFGVIAIKSKSKAKLAIFGIVIAIISNIFLLITAGQITG